VDLTVHEQHFIDLNPNRKAATKGGSLTGIFQMYEASTKEESLAQAGPLTAKKIETSNDRCK
jgi:hypothetical protein